MGDMHLPCKFDFGLMLGQSQISLCNLSKVGRKSIMLFAYNIKASSRVMAHGLGIGQ